MARYLDGITLIFGLHFNLVPERDECVPPDDPLKMTFVQVRDPLDDVKLAGAVRMAFLHNIQEISWLPNRDITWST